MTTDQFIQRIRDIINPYSGIKPMANQKAMIAEAYDIHITGLTEEHAQSRTEALLEYLQNGEDREQALYEKARYEQDHDL